MAFHLSFDPADYPERDAAIHTFRAPLKAMVAQGLWRHGNPHAMVYLLGELAKNTFDHSNGIGLLSLTSWAHEITYLDTGKAFDWAYWCQPGVSSKPLGAGNVGLGLAHILTRDAKVGYSLSVQRTEAGTEFKFTSVADMEDSRCA